MQRADLPWRGLATGILVLLILAGITAWWWPRGGRFLAPGGPSTEATQDRVSEVVREAQQRIEGNVAGDTPWRHLTPELLRRWLEDDVLAQVPWEVAYLLLHEAGAWDLLHFERPSDILRQWQRMGLRSRKRSAVEKRVSVRDSSITTDTELALVNEDASDEAGAMFALWTCLPEGAWWQDGLHPLLRIMKNDEGWAPGGSSDNDLGDCVRQQKEWAPRTEPIDPSVYPTAKSTRRGLRSALVLRRKLAAHLSRNECRGQGADDCLVVMQVLLALDSDPAVLWPLAERVSQAMPLPDAFQKINQLPFIPAQQPSDEARADELVPAGVTREIVLDMRLDVLTRFNPARWPTDQPQATLVELAELHAALGKLEVRSGRPWQYYDYRTSGNWGKPSQRVADAATAESAWLRALFAAGQRTGETDSAKCSSISWTERIGRNLPAPAELGWALRRLALGQSDCGRLPRDELAQRLAAGRSDPIAPSLHEILAAAFGQQTRAAEQVSTLRALQATGACPLSDDVLGLCSWLRDARDARSTVGVPAPPVRPQQIWASESLPDGTADNLSTLPALLAARQPAWGSAATAALAPLLGRRDIYSISRLHISRDGCCAAIAVELTDEPYDHWPAVIRTGHLVLLLDRQGTRLFSLATPSRDGALDAVSDLDKDGAPEFWWRGSALDQICHSKSDTAEDSERSCERTHWWLLGEPFGNEIAPYLAGAWPAPRPR